MGEGKILYDTSFYIEVLRSKSFAESFRSRYEADIPMTFFSSVVVQELLAGATDRLKRAVVEALYRPFVNSRRIATPTHSVWEEAGRVLGVMRGQRKDQVDRLAGSFVNDLLVALSARAMGARVVTLNSDDFTPIRKYLSFGLEILKG
ncbi:MAG: type II toxin-antitoxin system VapC family toxin [Deltaproteobacteria bacterium]|nr:type II toxin-antitoxin system VapC family toxin [Deltaproteobacteria bacterium]